MTSASKIAILHDDSGIAATVARLATKAELEIVRPESVAQLEALLCDPMIAAVVLDIVGPNSAGFDLLERVAKSPSHPLVIVVTALDVKTVDSIRRLGSAKGLKLRVFRKTADNASLKTCLTTLEKRGTDFAAADLDEAIERGFLRVEYQPKVPLNVGAEQSCAVEALCRINHPRFGNVYPDQFIAIAEKEGLICKLTDAVACQAFRDWCKWRDEGLLARLAINVSPELLKDGTWCEMFMRRCEEFGVDPERITLEITETSSGAAHATALDVLTRLRLKGFTLSIDDFGTGFSSLATLYKLPFGELKIDKSFTFDLQESAEARALIESTIGMAQRLGLKVVAEGVETEEVFHELRLMGCQDAQGYFISKAIPADKIPPFFAEWNSVAQSEPVSATPSSPLPKIAMIQALLADILNDQSVDSDTSLALSDIGKPSAGGAAQADPALEAARKIPPLVLQGSLTAALAHCHKVARRLEKREDRGIFKAKILELQKLLETDLLCTADIEFTTANGPVRLLRRDSALIGRPSSVKAVDVAIGCRWFSRGEKNLRVFAEGGDWFVEDLGSTNGSAIGDEALKPHQRFALPAGETLIEIGKRGAKMAPIALRIRRSRHTPGALSLTLQADQSRLAAGGENQWPSFVEDLKTSWIIFQDAVSVGSSTDCAMVLEEAAAERAAEIHFREGYRVTPCGAAELAILGTVFHEETPLPAPADISIGGAALHVAKIGAAGESAAAETPARRANAR